MRKLLLHFIRESTLIVSVLFVLFSTLKAEPNPLSGTKQPPVQEQAIRVVRHLEKNHVFFAGRKYTNMQSLCEDAGLPFNKVKAYAVNRQISIHKAVRAFLKVQRAEGVRELAKKYGEQE